MQFARERRRQPALVERVERLARRQLRGASQATGAPLAPFVRFELEHLEEERERGLLFRFDEPRDELAGGRGESEALMKTALMGDAIRPPRATLAAQQRAFNRFLTT